jgi:hypothetical protein
MLTKPKRFLNRKDRAHELINKTRHPTPTSQGYKWGIGLKVPMWNTVLEFPSHGSILGLIGRAPEYLAQGIVRRVFMQISRSRKKGKKGKRGQGATA